jgi:hypothetical protein
MRMSTLKSRYITGVEPQYDTLIKLREKHGIPVNVTINLRIFEVKYERKKYYCCWSRGVMKDGEPHLTLVGHAAAEALLKLPLGNSNTLHFIEIFFDSMPLRDQVKAMLRRLPGNSKICFFGNIPGELGGIIFNASNDSIEAPKQAQTHSFGSTGKDADK